MPYIKFKLNDPEQQQSAMEKLSSISGAFKVVCDTEGGFVKTDINAFPENVKKEMQEIAEISEVELHFLYDK